MNKNFQKSDNQKVFILFGSVLNVNFRKAQIAKIWNAAIIRVIPTKKERLV